LLSVSAAAPLVAAPKKKPASNPAEKRFRQAKAFFDLGEFEQALEAYKESYLLSSEPEILFNIGQCYFELKRYEEAQRSYRIFLRDAPNVDVRALVEERLVEIDAILAEQAAQAAAAQAAQAAAAQAALSASQPASSPVLVEPEAPAPAEKPRRRYGLVLGLAGASLGAGGVAFFFDRRLRAEDDFNLTGRQRTARLVAAISADALLLGTLGAFVLVRNTRVGLAAVPAPGGATMALSFSPSWESR
jgi:tetratricopeptide (TPR) repeat protein